MIPHMIQQLTLKYFQLQVQIVIGHPQRVVTIQTMHGVSIFQVVLLLVATRMVIVLFDV